MKKIVGVFKTYESAQRAIEELKAKGYNLADISLVAKDKTTVEHLETATDVVAENVGTGVAAGGLLGGLGGLLVGLGALVIPGVGPIIAAGPLAATLTGAAAGGLTGGLIGALTGIGVDETEAAVYEKNFNEGDILVMVDSDAARDPYAYDVFSRNESLNREYYPDEYRRKDI